MHGREEGKGLKEERGSFMEKVAKKRGYKGKQSRKPSSSVIEKKDAEPAGIIWGIAY